jgi:hypothetical protein
MGEWENGRNGAFTFIKVQIQSRQGWQNVATWFQPVVDSDNQIKPRGNIYRNDSNR